MRTEEERRKTQSLLGPVSAANKQAEGAFCSPSLEDTERWVLGPSSTAVVY